jgi:hypothetical protein
MTATAEALLGLLDKYREIRRLRHAATAGDDAEQAARAMASLASRFPGALRELDQRTLPDIEARVAGLEAAIAGAEPIARWMELWIAYHGWLRVALRIKRKRLMGEHAIWQELVRDYAPGLGEPALSALDPAAVREILRPPGGRLNTWAFQRVAEAHGLPAASVAELLFEPLAPAT